MTGERKIWLSGAAVFVFALLLNWGAAVFVGVDKPVRSDALYFKELAANLAQGKGYVQDSTFWPGQPSMQRMPGWPALLAAATTIFPAVGLDALMRLLAGLLNAVSAWLVYRLARRVAGDGGFWPVLCGLAAALHPVALSLAVEGLSESLFTCLALAAASVLLAWSRQPGWWPAVGGLLAGSACLVRANFVLLAPALLALGGGYVLARRRRVSVGALAACALGVALFLLPPGLWLWRNYGVCGKFPVLSTLRGQTFYGGNNAVVAQWGREWGYWIFPDAIPGEQRLCTLSRSMGEQAVDAYYYDKGREFLRGNPSRLPGLLLGKLVRAYVPLPWTWSAGTLGVAAYRLLLYAAALAALLLARRVLDRRYLVLLAAMLLTNVAGVLVFWGCARFAFVVEPFLVPLLAGVAVRRKQSGGFGDR